MISNREINIEIRGVSFVNKGAELMLNAVIQQIRKRYPNAKMAMELNIGKDRQFIETQYQKIRSYGLYVKPSGRRYKIPAALFAALFLRFSKMRAHLLPEKDIHVVLDASGFAFGDQWGATFAKKRLSDDIEKWKLAGKKIILLPQAFGPFGKHDVVKEVNKIIHNVDLVFARDKLSYEHLKALSGADGLTYLRPDFTNLSLGEKPISFDQNKYQVAVIPNFKMLNGGENAAAYLHLLKEIVTGIQKRGYTPFFLMHEGKKDEDIALKVNSTLAQPLAIIWEENPLKLKGIIGAVHGVVTSRFHGLVSALSQGVPSLATSWSHKYEMLLADYAYSEALVKPPYQDLEQKIDLLLDEDKHASIRAKLREKASIEKEKSVEMWEQVFKVVDS
ncbi:polysaccharide pyruvyl transferase family protein [Olivibacter sp. SDN3]|uniref:polysaccharide pyruvyl transferase family protein n=1 Tax=Olivibacter sp. SDN3 TaxID=2764720 RepID=UPI001651684F|nr:polysaccharide pyruvyl transferase family protein [Olivibacter sp. SDN3]QNL51597.1 polysaccharide pyruvyl transferase family protein [Olivibacter sp. SDN3]